MKFNFLDSNSSFPNLGTVDVYKYDNDFDYSRYDNAQMEILICAVPWDVGEAHVGQRTISGIGNVVYFETKESRDNWFDSIPDEECIRITTKYKELHRDQTIDVPIPFDMAARFNYMVVRYHLFANDDSPVQYEKNTGVRDWFWFIRDVEFIAPNTTRLHLLDDAFQTWIYDVEISGMILERGHAPLFQTQADEYLADPIDNCSGLLAPDFVLDNSSEIVTGSNEIIFNGKDVMALIVTSANPLSSLWGSKASDNWKVPAPRYHYTQGIPSFFAFAIKADDLTDFLISVFDDVPQFAQTMKAVCFISKQLLELGDTFKFCQTTCYRVGSNYKTLDVIELDKGLFAYDDKYSNIAKLYTYPYSKIEISDGKEITEIRIETTNGKISLTSCLNLVYPWLRVTGHINDIGKSSTRNLSFHHVSKRNINIKGNWYQYLFDWDIPTFGIVQQASKYNDYITHFDREQQRIAYTNDYDSAIASANTQMADRNASATTARTNAGNDAANIVNNATLQTTYNTASTTENNSYLYEVHYDLVQYETRMAQSSNNQVSDTVNNEIEAANQQAAIAAASGVATSAVGAISQASSGNIAGAISSLIGGGVQAAETLAQNSVTVNLTSSQAEVTTGYNTLNCNLATGYDSMKVTNNQNYATAQNTLSNSLTSGTAANSASTINANAANTYSTDTGNATRDYNTQIANAGRMRNTAINAIENQISQAALDAPFEFGDFENGDEAATRPMGLYANVVTLDDYSVSAIGDEFLRYGYTYGKQWDFESWNIGDKFTYWKLSDFWVKNLNVPDLYMDKLRFFLFGGVTIWRDPAFIGTTSIYDNGI